MPEICCILLVGDNLLEVDNVPVMQLLEYLDLPHCSDGEAFLLILKAYFLECNHLISS